MLQIILSEENPDIICLQETNLKQNKITILKNYNKYNRIRTNPNIASGGVSIMIRNEFNVEQINLDTNLEAIAVKILGKTNINICNIYSLPGKTVAKNDVEDLINQIPKPRIIMGDMNAYSYMWGATYTDQRGKILEEILDQFNLCLLNDGDPTRFNINTGESTPLDLTICDGDVFSSLTWQKMHYTYNSDHYPIIIENNQNNENTPHIPKWNLKKADWILFSQYIEENIPNCLITEDINISMNNL